MSMQRPSNCSLLFSTPSNFQIISAYIFPFLRKAARLRRYRPVVLHLIGRLTENLEWFAEPVMGVDGVNDGVM